MVKKTKKANKVRVNSQIQLVRLAKGKPNDVSIFLVIGIILGILFQSMPTTLGMGILYLVENLLGITDFEKKK